MPFKSIREILDTQGSIIRWMMLKDGMKWLWHNGKLQKLQHSLDAWRTSQYSGLRGGKTVSAPRV